MISLDKTYKTRDGREVKLWWIGPGGFGPRTVFGAVKYDDGGWWPIMRFENGRANADESEGPLDLIEAKPRHKRKVWVNIYRGVEQWAIGSIYHTREDAESWACRDRIACLERELDFEEGEGL